MAVIEGDRQRLPFFLTQELRKEQID